MDEQKRKSHREYMRLYNATEKGAEYNRNHVKQWRQQNPDARAREYASVKANGKTRTLSMSPEQRSDFYRKHDLKRKYGVTPEWYDEQLNKQNRVCAVCGDPPADEKKRRLAVDHDHRTNKIRGLLCSKCNTSLERIDNIPGWCEKVVKYLEEFK